jgi:hypothetical protein
MAPEQSRGETHLLDGRTDIWALGVILYELLTRRRPFLGRDSGEIFQEIRTRDPKPLRQLAPQVDRSLEQIVLTCLQKDPSKRFTTAADLIEELRRWQRLTDQPPSTMILPGPSISTLSLEKPARRWVRPAAVAAIALLIVGLIVVVSLNIPAPTPTETGAFIELQPEDLQVQQWYPLLTASEYPRPVWHSKEGAARFLPQPESETITLSPIDYGLVALGSTRAREYKLQLYIEQKPWAGSCGVFWGLHKGPDGALLCQALMLERGDDAEGRPTFVWQRRWIRANLGSDTPFMTGGIGNPQHVDYPGFVPHKLELTIRGGIPVAARWDAVPMPEFQPNPAQARPDDGEFLGQFGILARDSQTIYRAGQIMLLDSPDR